MGIKRVLLQCALMKKIAMYDLYLCIGPQENDSEDKDSFYHEISV